MGAFSIIRLVVFGLVFIFSFVVMGLDAHFTDTLKKAGATIPLEGMGIATAVFTILTLPVVIFSRKGAFTAKILFEAIWLFILWVFWLTTAALGSSTRMKYIKKSCFEFRDPSEQMICNEISAIEGISYVNWILLFGYTTTVIVLSFMASARGHPYIWTSTVSELPYGSNSSSVEKIGPMPQTVSSMWQQPPMPQA